MTCKMCKRNRKLCKAHIYPNNLREFLFHENVFIEAAVNDGRPQKKKTLSYDKHLFCRDCDNLMSNYEKELKKTLKAYLSSDEINLDYNPNQVTKTQVSCYGNDLYLGLLSILWKSSMSNKLSTDLGSKYNEIFMSWIQDKQVPSDHDKYCRIEFFGCLEDKNKLHMYTQNQPVPYKQKRIHCYFLYLFGFSVIIKIGQDISNNTLYPDIIPQLTPDADHLNIPLLPFEKSPGFLAIKDLHKAIHRTSGQQP